MLWSVTERNIFFGDETVLENRKRFENWISIMNIGGVKRLKGKHLQSSFAVVISGGERAYVWKAATSQRRDEWIAKIKSHQKVLMSLLDEQTYANMALSAQERDV